MVNGDGDEEHSVSIFLQADSLPRRQTGLYLRWAVFTNYIS